MGPRAVSIAGDTAHPANFGRLCVKGSALGETVGLHGRLLQPKWRSDNTPNVEFHPTEWSEALDRVANEFRRIIDTHGPESVAFYVSGQLLTEDYYVANKFVKGYLGTANIDTNSRLCMSSAVAGHKRAFGEDLVPVSYADLESAELIVLVGSNTAWCHPVLYQRIMAQRERRPDLKLVVIDPRRTPTADSADLHLPIRPGSDVALFNGLLQALESRGLRDTRFVSGHTRGIEAALGAAAGGADPLAETAAACDLDPALLQRFYDLFAAHERCVTAFSMGVNQSSAGTDKVNAIINVHLLTGRIGRPGMGPFSITGQPNAMGGREVGGLANMLAAHMDLDQAAHRDSVQTFWNSPAIADRPGLKAVDLFGAIESGQIKAVWIMATNPVVSLPDADQVRRALAACEFVVVSEVIERTDTTAYAHVLLPAHGWGEKDGTVTNSERCISRQRPFLAPAGEARSDWWMISEVARRLGWGEGFAWKQVHEVFAEHARLSGFRNDGARFFDISAYGDISASEYAGLKPFRWPAPASGHAAEPFTDGRFAHADGRARFVAVIPSTPFHSTDNPYPLVLNSGRVRDHWHTMTRTGLAPRLAQHISEPFVAMHREDAAARGLADQALARVRTRWGTLLARVRLNEEMRRGEVFVPIHWTAQTAARARVGALVNPVVDPISGEPEFKHTPAQVEAVTVDWQGFALLRRPEASAAVPEPAFEAAAQALGSFYWTRITGEQMVRYELAGSGMPTLTTARAVLGGDTEGEWLEFEDAARGVWRIARLVDGRIEGCLFVCRDPASLPTRQWLSALFTREGLGTPERGALLAGEPAQAGVDAGPTVCSCFGVGRNTLLKVIREGGLKSPADVTRCAKAGGNCGSCVPEIRKLIAQVASEAPAAVESPTNQRTKAETA